MDFRSCSLQADGEGVLITVPHPTSMEQDEHIQLSYCIPKCTETSPRVWGLLTKKLCVGLTCSGCTVLPRGNMDERLSFH